MSLNNRSTELLFFPMHYIEIALPSSDIHAKRERRAQVKTYRYPLLLYRVSLQLYFGQIQLI
jgi:hypothetical protein